MNRKNKTKTNANLNDRLGSFDLEPPKIYRNAPSESNAPGRAKTRGRNKAEIRRSQDKKRRLKRSVRKAIAAILIVLLLAGAGITLSLTVFFKIETVSPSGSGIYSTDEIIAASGIDIGDNLFLIDTAEIAEKIETALPWVYSVRITRALPSEVKIVVTDAVAAYAIKNEDKTYILLDDTFKVLEEASEKRTSGTVLIADGGVVSANSGYDIEFENDDIAAALKSLAEAIESTSFTQATKIKSKGLSENYIVYDGRITFKLGSLDDLETEIYRGLTACSKLDASNPEAKGTLDLTYDKEAYFTDE